MPSSVKLMVVDMGCSRPFSGVWTTPANYNMNLGGIVGQQAGKWPEKKRR
jgi:hypothetical protein